MNNDQTVKNKASTHVLIALSHSQGDYHVAHKASLGIHVGLCIFEGYWVLFFGKIRKNIVINYSFNYCSLIPGLPQILNDARIKPEVDWELQLL